MTAIACSACERPVCTDCMVTTPVGMKCPECAKLPARARAAVPPVKLAAGCAVAGACAGAIVVAAPYVFQLAFVSLFVAYALGILSTEAVRRAAGGFRDVTLARVTTMAVGVGFFLPLVLDAIDRGAFTPNPWDVLAAPVAAWGAWTRW